jgi:amidophosphoribosyltransferase
VFELDRPHEECGVVGIWGDPAAEQDVARLCFFALYALQHRGQESAGIAASDGLGMTMHKAMGLVAQVFDERAMQSLRGHMAIGHNRYSTSGSSHVLHAQPYRIETMWGPLAVGHNGNLTNTALLRRRLLERGVGLSGSSDSEVITQLLAAPPGLGESRGPDWVGRIRALMGAADGAYSVVVLTREGVFGVRDPLGMRPLCLGVIDRDDGAGDGEGGPRGYVLASESCALGTVGARYVREIEPGEIVHLGPHGVRSIRGAEPARSALCVFEYVYFSRPDSLLEDQSVHHVRQRLGAQLATEAPADADVVIGVPDSAVPAAIGYARALGLPYSEGLTKNRYIGRTFIEPTDGLRRARVRLKYNALRANLQGRRVVLIDDSIVRGNTAGPLVRLLREDGGAAEVHVRVSSPPVRHPCFMGVDMATHDELIAHREDVEGIRRAIGADSLGYLSYDGMMQVVASAPAGENPLRGHCGACFDGRYPLPLPERERSVAAEGAPS